MANLEGSQKCDELFSFGELQPQAEFVSLNGMRFRTRRAKAPGDMRVFQAIGIEHLFEACRCAVMQVVPAVPNAFE